MSYSIQDYEVIRTIGKGSYGICNKIRRKKDGKILVWKELDYGGVSEKEKSMLVSEVNLLRELKHKHIVRYYDRIIDRSTTTLYIIMEYCEGGDLATYIKKMKNEGKAVEESFIWKISYQILLALRQCHSGHKNGRIILHRDLKPANVFLDSNMDVKLGDFGLARMLCSEARFAETFIGTPYYMSPEQMNQMLYNEKSDIWSLGCLLFELCTFRPPFTANKQRQLALKICSGRFPRIPSRYSDDLNEFISSMLQVDQSKRPTAEQLVVDPLLLKHVQSAEVCPESDEKTRGSEREHSRENLLNEREVKLNERERHLSQREKQLRERERACKLKELQLHAKEKELILREIQLSKVKNLVAESFKTPSPNLHTHQFVYDSAERESSGSVPDDVHDTCIQSGSDIYARISAKAQHHLPNCGEKQNYTPHRPFMGGDKQFSADSAENRFNSFCTGKRRPSQNPSCRSSPGRKIVSPATEALVYVPKLLTTKAKRSPLETLSDSNHQLTRPQPPVNAFNSVTSGTTQNIKYRLLKMI